MNTDTRVPIEAKDVKKKTKMSLGFKITMWIIGAVAGIPILLILGTMIVANIYLSSHEQQLNNLKKDTTSLFSNAPFATTIQYCGDAEFENRCTFTVDANDATTHQYLVDKGFSVTADEEYDNGSLHIRSSGEQQFTSTHRT